MSKITEQIECELEEIIKYLEEDVCEFIDKDLQNTMADYADDWEESSISKYLAKCIHTKKIIKKLVEEMRTEK